MAKGIIYVMKTVVPGLIKIGKTSAEQFENRMRFLENNGYNNVTGLKREFAIEVEEYDKKEVMLHDIFNKSRVLNSELFAIDEDLVIQLLTSFEGRQIYPENETKEQVFAEATENRQNAAETALIPNGEYYIKSNKRNFGQVTATMRIEYGKVTILKGSIIPPSDNALAVRYRHNAEIENNVLIKDFECDSVNKAGVIVIGSSVNSWIKWKTADGKLIDSFRQNHNE